MVLLQPETQVKMTPGRLSGNLHTTPDDLGPYSISHLDKSQTSPIDKTPKFGWSKIQIQSLHINNYGDLGKGNNDVDGDVAVDVDVAIDVDVDVDVLHGVDYKRPW